MAPSAHLSQRPGWAPVETEAPHPFLHLSAFFNSTLSGMFSLYSLWLPTHPSLPFGPFFPSPCFFSIFTPYNSTLLIPRTVSPIPSSKFAFFLWSPNPLLILFALHSLIWFSHPSLPPPSPPQPRSSQPYSFPLAESPLISIRLPSAREEMKIDSPSSNCFSLGKEKGEAVSRALSKAVHPSPFEVWRQGCSQISVAQTETAEIWVRGAGAQTMP